MIANPNDGNSPRVEVATPMIDVSAEGLITATTEQEAGYVPGGSKSATQQLPTQAAKTVTPGTTNQTAVASGRYTTGDVDVAGDANLKAENIAEGVSIFGVIGALASGGALHYESNKVIENQVITTTNDITKFAFVCLSPGVTQALPSEFFRAGAVFTSNNPTITVCSMFSATEIKTTTLATYLVESGRYINALALDFDDNLYFDVYYI